MSARFDLRQIRSASSLARRGVRSSTWPLHSTANHRNAGVRSETW